MPRRSPFKNYVRSRRVTRVRYREQWAWWAASGWQMLVADAADGGLDLFSYKQKVTGSTVSWGAQASAEQVATPDLVRLFLTETLYCHLHPRKAAAAQVAHGQVCTDVELLAFIRRQRHKAALLYEARRLGVE